MEGATAPSIRRRPAGSAVRPALVLLAALSLALAVAVGAAALGGPVEPAWFGLLFPMVGTAYVGSGLLAWYRRPANRTGPLLVAAGLVGHVAGFELTGVPGLREVGFFCSLLPIAAILHLVLAFPTGRLTTRPARLLATAGYVLLVGGDPVFWGLPPGALAAAATTKTYGAIAVLLATAVLLGHRFRRAAPAQRRTLAPLYVFGVLTIVYIVVAANLLPPLFGVDLATVSATQVLAIGLIPFAFAAGVLRGGFARAAALEDLGSWLARGDRDPAAVRAAVADTLGDPSAQVVFPVDDGYVDAAGGPVAPGRGRAVTPVRLDGGPVAAIVHAAVADAAHVEAVGGVVAIALDRQRLVAELLASRARVTEAADAERRRIARDLHDGIQARLVLLRLQAAGSVDADPGAVVAGLDRAIDELRQLVHGVMPAMLVENGLGAAVEDLADRLPVPTAVEVPPDDDLSPAVQTTAYFVVAEALSNAVKHADASRIGVRIHRDGSDLHLEVRDDGRGGAHVGGHGGLRGARDRVEALGGRFHVADLPGGGTRLQVGLPCGS
ncbi:ATP-binding protein [Pseudonocardia sp. WMMC193]|uniref:sensor histidine kinase n=1 Tax=Pseudonocardia sp. WMMC193 TaxID=2911965 RepID=UPI001F16A49D|nr:ATP-binding protein [Pseudonocardia sp. WMMC193]MCF7552294.1 ATP-binding protein [Pseudonocardia sp. WMMC193]